MWAIHQLKSLWLIIFFFFLPCLCAFKHELIVNVDDDVIFPFPDD